MWHLAEQFQVRLASHQHLPDFLDGFLQEKIQRIFQGVKSPWPDSRLARRSSHTHGRTLRHSDVFRHCSCFRIFLLVWAHRKCLHNCQSHQKKERTTEPNHQPKQALCAIVHQRRASTQIKQQSSICLHYIQQFATSPICTLAMQENKVLRLFFFPHAKDVPSHQNTNIQRLCLQETD